MLGGAGGRGGSRVKCRSGRARMLPRVGRIPDRRVARLCRRSSSALSYRGYLSIHTKVRDKPWPSVRAAQEGLSRSSLLFHVSVWRLCGLQRGTCLEAHRLSFPRLDSVPTSSISQSPLLTPVPGLCRVKFALRTCHEPYSLKCDQTGLVKIVPGQEGKIRTEPLGPDFSTPSFPSLSSKSAFFRIFLALESQKPQILLSRCKHTAVYPFD